MQASRDERTLAVLDVSNNKLSGKRCELCDESCQCEYGLQVLPRNEGVA